MILVSLSFQRGWADTDSQSKAQVSRLLETTSENLKKLTTYLERCRTASAQVQQFSAQLAAAKLDSNRMSDRISQAKIKQDIAQSRMTGMEKSCNALTFEPRPDAGCLASCEGALKDENTLYLGLRRMLKEWDIRAAHIPPKLEQNNPSPAESAPRSPPGGHGDASPTRAEFENANPQKISGWRVRGEIFSPLSGQTFDQFQQALQKADEPARPIYGPLPDR